MGGEIVDFAEIPRHQRIEPQFAIADRHQPEEVAGERLRQLGKGPLDDVGDRHVDVDITCQLMQDFQAAVLLENVLITFFQLNVVIELG